MKIFIIDTEFLSWNKNQSNISPNLRPLSQPAEIIQLYIKEIYVNFKNERFYFVKPKNFKEYPYRISQLTGIKKKYLDKYGDNFNNIYEKLVNFLPSKSLIISNGDEYKIINHNIKINSIKKKNKKIKFFNFYHLIKKNKFFKNYKKINHISITDIKRILKIKIKNHDAKNDVQILIECIKKLNIKISDLKTNSKFFKVKNL